MTNDPSDVEAKLTGLLQHLLSATHLNVNFTISRSSEAPSDLVVHFTGTDTPLLAERNGELLAAIEHLTRRITGVESAPSEAFFSETNVLHPEPWLTWSDTAVAKTQESSRPYLFSSMSTSGQPRFRFTFATSTRSGA